MPTIGQRIKQLRLENNLTQEDFGKLFGIVKSTVSMYESDKSIPDDEIKKKIAEYFQVTLDWLMGISEIRNPADKITDSVSDDPELAKFWDELKNREDLKLLFKQIKDMPPSDVKKIIRVIKAIEDEEAAHDDL
ncbi:XRE family transcriptional regulator [Biomaibacter acetigenes]|uniref:XRE family transcriptional regulator n=1 Tax=Biomaibacter acetigenes TaxID=2316383 RepID=A0A3G2R633_9FIRM|nr:helix-turn-helix transcriptional regulator [Biomaibacter acetigenes]AYO30843.1 XRE family transcriptional regulator [Biomaibacter acetigenes]